MTLLPRRITAALGALAIALGTMTATAQPARAHGDDLAKVLAGVAAIAIIGTALNNQGHARPTHAQPVRPHPGWHRQPPPRKVHAPQRPPQSCVRSGRQVVCGQPINRHQPRPQHPGWHHRR